MADNVAKTGAVPRGKRPLVMFALLVLVLAIGVLDVITGPVLDLTVLYLVPISLATVYLGLRAGLSAAFLAFAVEVAPPIIAGTYSPWLVMADGLTRLFVRCVGVYLIDRVLRQLREIIEFRRQRDTDLAIAREVHESFFAEAATPPRSLHVGHRLEFLREIGGDYLRTGYLGGDFFFCVCDISGKGVAAALFTAVLSQSISTALQQAHSLNEFVHQVNRRLGSVLPNDRFVTMAACVFDSATLTYVVAGHERPVLIRAGAAAIRLEDSATMPLGVTADLAFDAATIPFGAGDSLLVVTDGVTESPPFADDPDLLLRTAEARHHAGVQAVCDRVVELLGDADAIRDDVAVVCVVRVAEQ